MGQFLKFLNLKRRRKSKFVRMWEKSWGGGEIGRERGRERERNREREMERNLHGQWATSIKDNLTFQKL